MANETVEKAKADVKKGIAEVGKVGAYVKADAKADVEKVEAKFGHNDDLGKQAAYARADIKADAAKTKADAKNTVANAKADLEKAKAEHKK